MTHRVVAYTRLSRSKEDGASLARQQAAIEALCAREGWTIVETLSDDGISGRIARANADLALDHLRTGHATALVTWKLDRWSRIGLPALAELIDVLDSRPGSLFVALQDGLRSDATMWRMVAGILSEVARTESENISLRVASAKAWHSSTGTFRGGKPPYGYRVVQHPTLTGKKALELNPAEADILRGIARELLDGVPFNRIVLRLNAQGVRNHSGAQWRVTTLRNIVASPAIVGRAVVSKPDPTKGSTRRRTAFDVVRDDSGEPITFYEPVLDLGTWHRLLALIKANSRGEYKKANYLLSGLLYCSGCGRALYGNARKNRPGSSYRCASKSLGLVGCKGANLHMPTGDAEVSRRFLDVLGAEPHHVRETASSDTGELADVELSIRRLAERLAESDDDDELDTITTDLATLKRRRRELRSRPAVTTERWVPTGQTIREVWDATTDLDARRRILQANLAAVHVLDDSSVPLPDRLTLIFRPAWQPESGTPRTPGKV